MTGDAAKTQGRAAAPTPTGRSSEVASSWVYGLEGKEEGRDKSEGGSWEEESCGEEEEEDIEVSPTTLGQDASGRCHFIGGHWVILDYEI